MRKALALVALALGLVAGLAYAAYAALRALAAWRGGFWHEAWHGLFGVPFSVQRVLIGVSVLAVVVGLLLTPLAWAERRARLAFERRVEELRAERPDDAVTPYAGEEGTGFAFDGPAGRLLVLEPERGVGTPRVVLATTPDAPPTGASPPDA